MNAINQINTKIIYTIYGIIISIASLSQTLTKQIEN